MKIALIGTTGFVGSAISKRKRWSAAMRSQPSCGIQRRLSRKRLRPQKETSTTPR